MSGTTPLRTSIAAVVVVVLILVGAAMTAGWQFRTVAALIGNRAVAAAQSAQADALALRQARLRELTDVLTGDTHFTSYMTQALSAGGGDVIDTVSIHDQLEQRRDALRIDSAAIIDGAGRVVVAVGEGLLGSKDLSNTAVVAQANKSAGAIDGFLEFGGRVLWVSIAPLRPGESDAKLITAFVVNGSLMKEIALPSHADAALLMTTATMRRVVASSLIGAVPAQLQVAADTQTSSGLAAATPSSSAALNWDLGGASWFARPRALAGSDAFTLVTLVPAAGAADAWPAIALPLAILAAALLVLTIGIFVFFQRSFATPLANLTMLSERAVKGDYDMVYRGRQTGPVGRLGGVFNHLLNDLRRYRPVPGGPRRRSTDRK